VHVVYLGWGGWEGEVGMLIVHPACRVTFIYQSLADRDRGSEDSAASVREPHTATHRGASRASALVWGAWEGCMRAESRTKRQVAVQPM
jgi:hypothetical protein